MSQRLRQMSFSELYSMYDSSTDDSEKKQIHEAVIAKAERESISDGSTFQPYPHYTNPEFQDILFQKKEFNANQLFLDSTGIQDSCRLDFSIQAHQNFLKNFMTKESPYHSLLVYHGVGVGKTCSGLTMAENFRDMYARKDRRILILCSNNIQIGWKNTIYNPNRGENQCTGDAFVNSGATTLRETNKLIRQYYEIMAYQSFSNFVERMIQQYIQPLPRDEKEQGRIRCIQEYFSDRMMIIDEVHNIRAEQGGDMRDTVKTIEEVIRYSENLRLLLLTATPMYNRSSEIVWILNMMLLNDKRPLIQAETIFDKEGNVTELGEATIRNKSRGYVSYLRGENPITFPLRLYPSKLKHTNQTRLYPHYTKNNTRSIVSRVSCPKFNLVGGKIQSKFKFLEMFGSKLQGLQKKVYNQAIQNVIDRTPDLDVNVRGELNPILDNIMLTQITDMVYPSSSDNLVSFYGTQGLNECMKRKGVTYSYKKETLDTYGPLFDVDVLPQFSSKITSIIRSIQESEGIVFIYTNYVDSGIVPLKLALEQNGYKSHNGTTYLDFPAYRDSVDPKRCKREPISYDGLRKSEVQDSFQQATFMVIDGSTSKKTLQEQLAIVTSKENSEGQKIKVILGTVVASEGLDFKRIRAIHIMDPWVHLNRIEQTIGRGIRFCSHADLPENKRNVLIYLHVATLPSDRESIDTSIYRYAEKKSIQIGSIEVMLKQAAIDRLLYPDVNVIQSGAINKVSVKPPIYHSSSILVDPSDKRYSKVCSYSPECNYNSDVTLDRDSVELNEDTYLEEYSIHNIRSIKQKISLLYREDFVFDIGSILGLLYEYGFNHKDMILDALSQMLQDKYTVYDRHGNSGYLIQSHIYYVFQPYLYEDPTVPLYYRMNLHHREKSHIVLDRVDQVVDEGIFHAKYTSEAIDEIYRILDTEVESYEQNSSYPDAVSIVHVIEPLYPTIDRAITGYLFDRLTFHQKCALMYGYLHKLHFDSTHSKQLVSILSKLLIYKSTTSTTYYFNQELQSLSGVDLFGFFVCYNHKPVFIEYYEGTFQACNRVQINDINRSIKRYVKTPHWKEFSKHEPLWGYTTMRKRGVSKECVLKFVQPSNKGKVSTLTYPPGPGNVCIENNLASRIENIQLTMDTLYPTIHDILQTELVNNKKNICFLFELLLRQDSRPSFYPYDLMWLK